MKKMVLKKGKKMQVKADNPRKWDKVGDKKLLADSMKKFGDLSGIIWNETTNNFVGGNMRSQQLKIEDCDIEIVGENKRVDRQGTKRWGYVMWEVDGVLSRFNFRHVKWSKEKEDEACLAANKLGGVFDNSKLVKFFDRKLLTVVGFDLNAMDKKLAKKMNTKGQVNFSEFLGEEMNYVVLVFDTKIDWLNVQSKLGLERVACRYSNGKVGQFGIGRMVDGVSIIKRLKD